MTANLKAVLTQYLAWYVAKLGKLEANDRGMLDIMGHMSAAMLQKSSHFRTQARREAMDAVEAHTV